VPVTDARDEVPIASPKSLHSVDAYASSSQTNKTIATTRRFLLPGLVALVLGAGLTALGAFCQILEKSRTSSGQLYTEQVTERRDRAYAVGKAHRKVRVRLESFVNSVAFGATADTRQKSLGRE
jgi:hypothetical protein